MEEVVVWRGGAVVRKAKDDTDEIRALIRETKKEVAGRMKGKGKEKSEKRLIFLYDGPPDKRPVDAQMVCFTSSNEAWFKQLKKSPNRPKLTMPLWDLEELRAAAEELDLTMKEKSVGELAGTFDLDEMIDIPAHNHGDERMVEFLVEQRFLIFGGVARECLSTDETFVNMRELEIETTVKKFSEINHVRTVLDKTEAESKTHHCICHYVPDPVYPFEKETIAEPTTFVKRLLVECLIRLQVDKRNEVIAWLQGVEAAASFRGSLFEMGVHEKLNSGHTFRARRLGANDSLSSVPFECKKSTPIKNGELNCYFDNDFTASVLQDGPYHVPSAKNFASIDSFYFPKQETDETTMNGQDQLWMFQMTVAQKHPVNGAGLACTLERLGLLKMVEDHPQRVALIFVVPEEKAAKFGPQQIELETSNDNDSVSMLKGIGKKREKFLKDVGVCTIVQLRKLLKKAEANTTTKTALLAENLSFGTLRTILSGHDEKQKWSGLQSVFDSIPQFVWGLKSDETVGVFASSTMPVTSTVP